MIRRYLQSSLIGSIAVFVAGLALYISTLAPAVVFGDPAEYIVVPYTFGIVHPPGYAFMTVLVRVWQTLVPVGSIAYRTNLLAATVGALSAALVFGGVWALLPSGKRGPRMLAALFAAASLLVAPDFWQHSLHANAHIVTATLAVLALLLLLRWRAGADDRYLWGFCFVAGVGVTQHPLTVLGFPAFTAFIIAVRPRIFAERRTLLKMGALGVAGLFSWLYFPIRTAIGAPRFGPADLHTLDGFLNLVFARGLRVNLFAFGLEDQLHRLLVFSSLIRLQYTWPVLALAVGGLLWLARRDWRGGLLLGLHLAANLLFTMNSVQDVMAYLLIPIGTLAVCAGVGAGALARRLLDWVEYKRFGGDVIYGLGVLLFIWPMLQLLGHYSAISLREQRAADEYIDALQAQFEGQGRHAVLLSDWEHMTPLWYRQYAEGLTIDSDDLLPVYVVGSSATLWVDKVWEYIEVGPIYLIEYRRDIVDAGFRLRAEGPLYRVVAPSAGVPAIANPLDVRAGPIEWLGYEIQADEVVRAGQRVPIVLYMRAPEGTEDIIQPWAMLGDGPPGGWRFEWTTDSHWLSAWWQPGEVIAERWEIIVPLDAAAGDYPLYIGLHNLTGSGEALRWQTGGEAVEALQIGTLTVTETLPPNQTRLLDGLVANFGQRVGVRGVTAWAAGWRANAPWPEPQQVQAGDNIEIRINWVGLAAPEDSLTVFVHLLDYGNGLHASYDYTPLGGAFPTQLWFPKWLPGQSTIDPYRLQVPPDLPPGDYLLEIGLYGLRSVVRVPNIDGEGNFSGDRFVLGGIRVVP